MQLRDYQHEATQATWRYLCNSTGNPVIVLPTGAGKSLVIAELARRTVEEFGCHVLILAHRKELLEQNADKVRRLLPDIKLGLFSAGLRRWDAESPVVCAGIQSCWQKSSIFGPRHLVVIDEAHLVATQDAGMYRRFLGDLQAENPKARVVGLTATPYRTGDGSVCGPDKLFQAICYEAQIPRLIIGGYLSPVTSKAAESSCDTSGLHVRGGEFVQGGMEQLFDGVVREAVAEIVSKTRDRRSIICFASGVGHAEHVASEIERVSGERVGLVTGGTPPLERSCHLSAFKSGSLRWLINVDVLTTGFDAPNIDAIAVLRATCSPGLFAQICGRGFRLSPGKINCLILDFGGNVERHGALDDADYGKKPKQERESSGDAPTKRCPNCEAELSIQARECECGFIFPREQGPRHGDKAAEAALLESMEPPKTWIVEGVSMQVWTSKRSGTRTLRVDYECQPSEGGGNLSAHVISEWVCLEHEEYAGKRAAKWWRDRCLTPAESIEHAVELWNAGAVATPRSIQTKREGKFYRVVGYDLDEIPEVDMYRNPGECDGDDIPF